MVFGAKHRISPLETVMSIDNSTFFWYIYFTGIEEEALCFSPARDPFNKTLNEYEKSITMDAATRA